MYDPIKDGVEKSVLDVTYVEAEPPERLSELVHCFWQMRSEHELAENFTLHAMPDACVNLLFDQANAEIAGVTALQTTHTTLDLGRSFHYVGVQFFPGVWHGDLDATIDRYVGDPYEGDLPLVATNKAMLELDFDTQQTHLAQLIDRLAADGLVCLLYTSDAADE